MKWEVHVAALHIHLPESMGGPILSDLRELKGMMRQLKEQFTKGRIMASQEYQDLKKEIERNTTVDGSIKKLVEALVARQDDPAALRELITTLRNDNDSLAAVVVANTPAEGGGGTGGGETGGGETGGGTGETGGGETGGGETGAGETGEVNSNPTLARRKGPAV